MASPLLTQADLGPANHRGTQRALAANAERKAARERIHASVVHPIDTPSLLPDPLARRESKAVSAMAGLRLTLGAALIHALVVLSFALFGQLVGDRLPRPPPERVRVAIVEPPRTEPPPVPEPVRSSAAPVPEFVAPRPASRPPPGVRRPELKPPVEQAAEATPGPLPRRIVGLSFESTTAGSGPSFATGSTRMGETAAQAVDPQESGAASRGEAAPAAAVTPGPSAPRKASFIPTRDGVFTEPKRVRPSRPAYPGTLKAQNLEGDVTVSVTIDARGKVTSVTIVSSSGHAEFDQAARSAASAEQFSPALRDGTPVAHTLSYTYRFRIED